MLNGRSIDRFVLLTVALMPLVLVAGCGQKGDLYLPAAPATIDEQAQSPDVRKRSEQRATPAPLAVNSPESS